MTESDYEERYTLLSPIVHNVFDFTSISKLALGRHWKELTQEQQQLFQDTLAKLIASTYAQRFAGDAVSGYLDGKGNRINPFENRIRAAAETRKEGLDHAIA